jgi:hypothetical protein
MAEVKKNNVLDTPEMHIQDQKLELDETHRDLLNIILGSFIASFGKTIDFWFRHSKKTKEAK